MSFELIKDLGKIYLTEKSSKKYRYGVYRCVCGKESIRRTYTVENNIVKSCGCLSIAKAKEKNTKHGLRYHKLYNTWNNIIKRCSLDKEIYKNYYGRGIRVCERWLNIENFIEDMYPTYKDGLSIDRINNDGNYEPSNCRWVKKEIQARNTRLIHSTNKSGYRGVSWSKVSKKWIVQIGVNKNKIFIGYFNDKIEAAKAYDKYVIDNNLEHTRNFIEQIKSDLI